MFRTHKKGTQIKIHKWTFVETLFAIVLAILVLVILVRLWNLPNINFQETYTLPADNPGLLSTAKYGSFWWITQISSVVQLIFLLAAGAELLNITLESINIVIERLFFFITVLVLIFGITEAIIFSIEIPGCNQTPFNPCTDQRYCCVYASILDVNITVNGVCPVLIMPCLPTVTSTDLTWDITFSIGLSISYIVIVLATTLIIICCYIMRHKRSHPKRHKSYVNDNWVS